MEILSISMQVCRICLETCKNRETFVQFEETIIEKLRYCTGVVVRENDGMPEGICSNCSLQLSTTFYFVKKCQQSEEYLRQTLHTTQTQEDGMFETLKSEVKYEADSSFQHNNYLFSSLMNESTAISPNDDKESYFNITSNIEIKYMVPNEIPLQEYNYKRKSHKGEKKHKHNKGLERNKCAQKEALQCKVCGLLVQSNSAMIIHNRTHSGEKPYECSYCTQCFAQKSTLALHIVRRHSAQPRTVMKRHTCEQCGKMFVTATNLKIHLRTHTGETPYACPQCPRQFSQLGSLISHKRRHAGEKPFSCKICGKAFVEQSHLKRHKSVHSDEKPFSCNICGKGVKTQFALTQHLNLHTNEKKHICDKCGMSFVVKGNLITHMRLVHSERSGHCHICNKVFSNLVDHLIIHSGEKHYQCEICERSFSHKRGLLVHSRQHSSADKYRCTREGCTQTFYARWLLDCHLLKHTGHTPYVCNFCSKGFFRSCHLTKHLRLHHLNN